MLNVGFVYDDIFLTHETPSGHVERVDRLLAVVETLKASGFWDRLVHIKPRKAAIDDIRRVHADRYIEKVSTSGPGYLNPDTYISTHSFEVALYAAGGILEAIDRCIIGEVSRAFCAVRPPGHHAEHAQGMGFCIFNNVAVGARYAQNKGLKRVFIIDFDVHHGNGTQHIFEDDDSVFYFSTHQSPLYPGTGRGSEEGTGRGRGFTFNSPLPPGAGDQEFGRVYGTVLPGLVSSFKPDLMLVSAGYDIHDRDPLASLTVSNNGIRTMVKAILATGVSKIVFSLEGGYNLPALSEGVLITIEEMLRD